MHSLTIHDESLVASIYVMAWCAIAFFSTCRAMVGGCTYFRAARWTFYIIYVKDVFSIIHSCVSIRINQSTSLFLYMKHVIKCTTALFIVKLFNFNFNLQFGFDKYKGQSIFYIDGLKVMTHLLFIT